MKNRLLQNTIEVLHICFNQVLFGAFSPPRQLFFSKTFQYNKNTLNESNTYRAFVFSSPEPTAFLPPSLSKTHSSFLRHLHTLPANVHLLMFLLFFLYAHAQSIWGWFFFYHLGTLFFREISSMIMFGNFFQQSVQTNAHFKNLENEYC